MPIEVKIDEGRGLVEVVVTDEVTEIELSGALDRYLSEPWSALPRGLLDLSDVAALDVSAHLVRSVAERAKDRVDPHLESGKFAIVAPGDFLFGMARMYEILRDESPVEVRVFRDRGEAELWLGIAGDLPPRRE